MKENGFWEVFRDTGDPLCWLLSRADKPRENIASEMPRRKDDPLRR